MSGYGMGCGGRGKLLFIASDTSSHMRDRGADGKQRRSDGEREEAATLQIFRL